MTNIQNMCCFVCLCTDKNLTHLKDIQLQCYVQILNEIPTTIPEDFLVWLCWDCEELLSRFSKFKHQVKHSYNLLQDSVTNSISQNFEEQKLATADCLVPINEHDSLVIKVEENWEDDHKGEIEITKIEVSVRDDDVDDDDGARDDGISDEESKFVLNRRTKVKGKLKKKSKKSSPEIYKIVNLTPGEVAEERTLMMAAEFFENSNIKCDTCIQAFPNTDCLNEHVINKHDSSKKFKCDTCGCTYSNWISFNYHFNKHVKRYQCLICTERLTSERSAWSHYEKCHLVDGGLDCGNCSLSFGTERDFVLHQERYHQDGDGAKMEIDDDTRLEGQATYSCEYCSKSFKWKTSLNKHSEMHQIEGGHKKKPYCEVCRLTFTSTANMQKHVKTSSKHQIQLKLGKLNDSLPADQTKDKRDACIKEIQNKINSTLNIHGCTHCDKKFQWKGNLLRHIKSHEAKANGELVCVPCARSFSSIATYKQHMRISKKHVSEEDFKHMCNECGKKFANKRLLKDHIDWEHLKVYINKCDICNKVYKTHTSLYLHKQLVHRRSGVELLCDHCGKSFPNHAKLRTHVVALHTTEQPFKCKQCPATFNWHSCLSRHVKVVHHKLKVKRKRRPKDD